MASKFWEAYDSAKPVITNTRDDVYNKLIMEGWFNRPQRDDNSPQHASTADAKKPKPLQGEVLGQVKDPGQSDAIYEEVWGKAPTYAEVYGQATNHSGTAAAIAPPEAPQVSNGHEPEL